jgi:hypothetical protein
LLGPSRKIYMSDFESSTLVNFSPASSHLGTLS